MAERYAVPDDLGWVATRRTPAPQVTIALLPDGPPFALHGASAAIWLAVVDLADPAAVVTRVAEETEQPEDVVREGVLGFLEELAGRGFLRPA
ncbi:PqqD family protein [Nocardioides mangrovicus]|uniref:PqqD family protein n=1 Tax=Nocardioides mangrovicus TaxID=2478913 RepID=A0A3L8NZD4_9ACTN|nr:PqqD family protein [Nocardioides mangrovicus]RLV47649.1 PqqD family protein [Nocardioides mangrovicus]